MPPDNNHAERQIRPAVIIRKNSLCNRSEQGPATQAILMSIYRTLKLRGHDPTKTIAAALREIASNRQTTAAAGQSRCRRVKCYGGQT